MTVRGNNTVIIVNCNFQTSIPETISSVASFVMILTNAPTPFFRGTKDLLKRIHKLMIHCAPQTGKKLLLCASATAVICVCLILQKVESQLQLHDEQLKQPKKQLITLSSGRHEPVLLHCYYHTQSVNHFYTTLHSDSTNKLLEWGYTKEGIEGKVFKSPAAGTVPLYRYYHDARTDHFYTTNLSELGAGKNGYTYEGIECYIYLNRTDGIVPLFRYWNPAGPDHFYTTDWEELQHAKYRWQHEGIAGYAFPKD